ncbi:MAG TPA: cell division protein SepF, partial [Abditibacteriaceae bacterium]
ESSYDSPDYSAGSMNNPSSKYASSTYPGSASGSASGRSNFSASSASTPGAGIGSSGGNFTGASSSRMRATNPTLRSREKNIYTIKPKRLDEATVAADCLKTGSAVIVNLEAVDRVTAVRIIDFMSGVCYGIDGSQGQSGHAMKLGEMIFLFTPAEFEITSDETDYAANSDHFFREMTEGQTAPSSAALQGGIPPTSAATPPAPQAGNSSFASSYNSPDYTAERRAWER